MPSARYGCSGAAIRGSIYIVGGCSHDKCLATVERYDTKKKSREALSKANPAVIADKIEKVKFAIF
jgi:hypothetical protein